MQFKLLDIVGKLNFAFLLTVSKINFALLLIVLFSTTTYAESTLRFPTTAEEFIRYLTPKPTSTRQRKGLGKGVESIESDNPKVGALILFDFDSSHIKTESYALLREFANALKTGLAGVNITIIGHTDSIGNKIYNLGLSIKRAEAVKHFLVNDLGVEETWLTTRGYGEIQPIATNETEEGRAKNRRVEFMRMD